MSPCAMCAGRALHDTVMVCQLPFPVRWHIVTRPVHGVAVAAGVPSVEVGTAVVGTAVVGTVVAVRVPVVVGGTTVLVTVGGTTVLVAVPGVTVPPAVTSSHAAEMGPQLWLPS